MKCAMASRPTIVTIVQTRLREVPCPCSFGPITFTDHRVKRACRANAQHKDPSTDQYLLHGSGSFATSASDEPAKLKARILPRIAGLCRYGNLADAARRKAFRGRKGRSSLNTACAPSSLAGK